MFSSDRVLAEEHPSASYFTLLPSAYSNSHFSSETPLCSPGLTDIVGPASSDPFHPLLALREIHLSDITLPNMSSNLLQLQTQAAHAVPASSRPDPTPLQNVLHVTTDDAASDSSLSSASSPLSHASLCSDVMRCSRCQRTASLDMQTGKSNMISYGLNLWYCNRCARLVGLTNR